MSAYRICEECGAALDPGERCDCRPAVPLKPIQPGSAQVGTYLRHEQLLNEVFAGVPLELTLALAEESRGGGEDHAEAKSDQNQRLQAGVRL